MTRFEASSRRKKEEGEEGDGGESQREGKEAGVAAWLAGVAARPRVTLNRVVHSFLSNEMVHHLS